MQLIQHIPVGSGGAASITFSAIPDTFTDLYLVMSLRDNSGFQEGIVSYRFNGVTSGYTMRGLGGSGSSAYSYTRTTVTSVPAGGTWGRMADLGSNENTLTANTFASNSWYIPNYRSGVAKSSSFDTVQEANQTNVYSTIGALLSDVTDPITSIALAPVQGTGWMEHTSVSLYGILAGSDGIVSVS